MLVESPCQDAAMRAPPLKSERLLALPSPLSRTIRCDIDFGVRFRHSPFASMKIVLEDTSNTSPHISNPYIEAAVELKPYTNNSHFL